MRGFERRFKQCLRKLCNKQIKFFPELFFGIPQVCVRRENVQEKEMSI